MADEIIQGDNGTVVQTIIKEDLNIVDIRGATVEFTIKTATRRFTKQGTVTDGINGVCEFILNSEDVSEIGIIAFQATITFSSGNKFSSDIKKIKVGQKL